MKSILIYIILFLINFQVENTRVIKEIELKSVDFGITSFFSIGCDNFETYFKDDISNLIISDKELISKFQTHIDNFKVDSTNYVPDIRAKLLIKYDDDTIDTLCMSDIGLIINQKSYLIDDDFVKLIESMQP